MIEVRKENVPLFERRPDAWPLVLILDRLEEPLRELRLQALEVEGLGAGRLGMTQSVGSDGPDERQAKEDDASWLLDQVGVLRVAAEDLGTVVNVDLQTALGPPGVASDPQAIEGVCMNILRLLGHCLEVEKNILSRRLHPDLQSTQFAFLGLTGDFIASHQDFVWHIREFLKDENNKSFSFMIALNTDRLLRAVQKEEGQPSPSPPPLEASKPAGFSGAVGGCLLLLAMFIIALLLPLPVLFVILLVIVGIKLWFGK